MGVKKFFLVIERFAFVKSLLFMSTLRKKKSLGHISHFPLPRSTFSSPPFWGCKALPKTMQNLRLFILFSLLFLDKLLKILGAGLV